MATKVPRETPPARDFQGVGSSRRGQHNPLRAGDSAHRQASDTSLRRAICLDRSQSNGNALRSGGAGGAELVDGLHGNAETPRGREVCAAVMLVLFAEADTVCTELPSPQLIW